jgi:hypothetical protein
MKSNQRDTSRAIVVQAEGDIVKQSKRNGPIVCNYLEVDDH